MLITSCYTTYLYYTVMFRSVGGKFEYTHLFIYYIINIHLNVNKYVFIENKFVKHYLQSTTMSSWPSATAPRAGLQFYIPIEHPSSPVVRLGQEVINSSLSEGPIGNSAFRQNGFLFSKEMKRNLYSMRVITRTYGTDM